MDVARVAPRLRGNVSHAVTAYDIAAEVVTLRERQLNLRPSRHVVGPIADLKGEVPHHPPICLLALIGMLTHATFITLYTSEKRKGVRRTEEYYLL